MKDKGQVTTLIASFLVCPKHFTSRGRRSSNLNSCLAYDFLRVWSVNGQDHIFIPPKHAWYQFVDPGGIEGLADLNGKHRIWVIRNALESRRLLQLRYMRLLSPRCFVESCRLGFTPSSCLWKHYVFISSVLTLRCSFKIRVVELADYFVLWWYRIRAFQALSCSYHQKFREHGASGGIDHHCFLLIF